jgi:predicted transcriptional regulator
MGEYRMTYAEVGDQLGYAEATIRNLVSEAYTEFEQLWLEGENDNNNNQQ